MSFGDFSDIKASAVDSLKSKTIGGVSRESAQEAIVKALEKVKAQADEVIGDLQRELQDYKNKTAQEMVQMTNEKDEAVFSAKANAEKEIAEAKKEAEEEIKKARAPRINVKDLGNGEQEIRKVNRNGAVMVKKVKVGGDKEIPLNVEITTLAGDYRKTKYNPLTGKPVQSFTDVNGDKITKYDDNGTSVSTKAVNVKKTKPEKPALVTQTQPRYVRTDFCGEQALAFDRIYSDGSKETITRVTNSNGKIERTKLETRNADDIIVRKETSWPKDNAKRIETYDPETGVRTYYEECMFKGKKISTKTTSVYDNTSSIRHIIKEEQFNGPSGVRMTATLMKDEYGLYTDTYRVKFFPPKSSGDKPIVMELDRESMSRTFTEICSKYNN